MKDESDDGSLKGPAQLMQGISDVNVLLAEPNGRFPNDEMKELCLQNLITSLNARSGLSVRPIAKSLSRKTKGTLAVQFGDVIKTGRGWLKEETCDLLIWGQLEMENQCVRWYFLSALEGEHNLGVPGFAENILIPFVPEQGSLDVLTAAIFAVTTPSHSSHALKIGEHLLGSVEPLTKLPTGLSSRKTPDVAKVSIMGMCSIILANIARRGEEMGWFAPAMKAFELWAELAEKEKETLDWALVKNHHGWLYEEMANHDDDELVVEHIEKAILIFEEVCAVFISEKLILEWAAVQFRMGVTCAKIGRSMSEPEYLQKAARYFKNSLDVYTQNAYPLNWADAMSRMAKTMMLHGQLVKGAQSLEQAGVAFQSILKVYTQDKYPAQWASTHNNLGATLFALAKRDPSTSAWLEHALICFGEARIYYEEIERPQMVHVIDKNIARAQSLKDTINDEINNDLLN